MLRVPDGLQWEFVQYEDLDESFSAIKVCTLKKISLFYFDPAKIMGIPQFTKDLLDILEKKSIS